MYRAIICGPTDCPVDPRFEHDNYFGCVPKTFNPTTGRAKGHYQTKSILPYRSDRTGGTVPGTTGRYVWDGGCSKAELDRTVGR